MSKPDFDGAKGYYWMKQTKQAIINGARDNLPRVPSEYNPDKYDKRSKELLKNVEFKRAVEQRLTRKTYS